jgi:hypothetical protein
VSELTELRLLNDQIADLRGLLLAALGAEAVLPAHLPAIVSRLRSELEQQRHPLVPPSPPTATFSLPVACQQMDAELCGRQDDDARISLANFRHPHRWRCRGCREEHDDDDLMS